MKWTRIESSIVYKTRRFNVRRDISRADSSGQQHEFHVFEFADWVNVIPLTADDHVIMVRQFRHGIGGLTLEVPAGILDPEDLSPEVAALRELREETGYRAAHIESLGVVHPNPATQHNHCHMFVAHGVEPAGPTEWDATEEIAIERVPRADLPQLVRKGKISNALTIVALHMLSLGRA